VRGVRLHDLRRTFAGLSLTAGVEVDGPRELRDGADDLRATTSPRTKAARPSRSPGRPPRRRSNRRRTSRYGAARPADLLATRTRAPVTSE